MAAEQRRQVVPPDACRAWLQGFAGRRDRWLALLITDAVKSADRAGLWTRRPAAERHAIVDAWAPVLRWELAQHRPLLIVAVGKPADRYLTRLERSGVLARLPERRRIPHYSYVAMRPDKWGRRAGHPERIEEYRALFAEIATRACELRAPT